MAQRLKASQFRLAHVPRTDRLARERRRLHRERLRRPGVLAPQVRGGNRALLDVEERRAGLAVEQKHEPAFRDLRDGGDTRATARDRHEIRGSGKVTIPEVVVHGLEMPQPLACCGLEREQRVREQIRTSPGATVEIGRRGSGRHVDDPPRRIDTHAAPAVGAPRRPPRTGRPSVVPEFPGVRDRVERPANRAGADVIGADVARRGPLLLTDTHALDQQVLVDGTGARRDEVGVADLARQSGGEIDRSGVAKGANRAAGSCVERIEAAACREQDPAVAALRPIHDTATDVGKVRTSCVVRRARVEAPNQPAALGVKGDDGERGSRGVQDAIDDDWRGLDFRGAAPRSVCRHVAGVVDPRHTQLRDVGLADLIECGVPRVTRVAARDAPVVHRWAARRAACRDEKDTEPHGRRDLLLCSPNKRRPVVSSSISYIPRMPIVACAVRIGALPARTHVITPVVPCWRSMMSSFGVLDWNTASSSSRYFAAWRTQGSLGSKSSLPSSCAMGIPASRAKPNGRPLC